MTTNDIDQTGKCEKCAAPIEHYAGVPGDEWMTPFWRHTEVVEDRPHPATPEPASITEPRAA